MSNRGKETTNLNHANNDIRNQIASAVLASLIRLAGGGFVLHPSPSSASSVSPCPANSSDLADPSYSTNCLPSNTTPSTTPSISSTLTYTLPTNGVGKSAAESSHWIEELRKLSYTSVSFPNGVNSVLNVIDSGGGDNEIPSKLNVNLDGKPHDVEVRVVPALFHWIQRGQRSNQLPKIKKEKKQQQKQQTQHRGWKKPFKRTNCSRSCETEADQSLEPLSSSSKRGRLDQPNQSQHRSSTNNNEPASLVENQLLNPKNKKSGKFEVTNSNFEFNLSEKEKERSSKGKGKLLKKLESTKETKEFKENGLVGFDLISDLGTRRRIDSISTLAKLVCLEFEKEFAARTHGRNALSTDTSEESLEESNNSQFKRNPVNEFNGCISCNRENDGEYNKCNKLAFIDIRPTSSGIIHLLTPQKSHLLYISGRLPCPHPHCLKWLNGEKGLWWHELQVHGVKYGLAVESASVLVEGREGAMVLFNDGRGGKRNGRNLENERNRGKESYNLLKDSDERSSPKDEDKSITVQSARDVFDLIRSGSFGDFVQLVKNGTMDPNLLDRNGASPLHWAAGCGHLNLVTYLIEECKCCANQGQKGKRSFRGRTPLHWAARNGHLQVVKYLVDKCDASIDAITADGTTAFCWAAWQGHLDVMKFLYQSKCDIHSSNSFGCNAVLWCAQGAGSPTIFSWLLDSGCNFRVINSNGHSPLHKAAQRGSTLVCKWLVERFFASAVPTFPSEGAVSMADKGEEDGFLFIGPDREGACPSDLSRMEGHESLARWLSKQEESFVRARCSSGVPAAVDAAGSINATDSVNAADAPANSNSGDHYSVTVGDGRDLCNNQHVPAWLSKELQSFSTQRIQYENAGSGWGVNMGIRRMALCLLNVDSMSSMNADEVNPTSDLNDID